MFNVYLNARTAKPSTLQNVHLQHDIPHYETTYRNLKKPKATGRIEEFIFRYLKFHQIATSHFTG